MIYFAATVFTVVLIKTLPQQILVKAGRKKINISLFIDMLPLSLLSVLRYHVGTDYPQYLVFFEQGASNDDTEVVFSALIHMCKWFFVNSYGFIIVLSMLFCIIIFVGIYLQSSSLIYSLILLIITGMYFYSLSMMRQSICIALFLLSLYYFVKKKYVYVAFIIGISVFLHISSIVYVVFYLFMILFIKLINRMNWKFIKAASSILLISLYFSSGIIRALIYLAVAKLGIYTGYFGSYQDAGNVSITHLLFAAVPLLVILLADPLKNVKNKFTRDVELTVRTYSVYYWGLWAATLWAVLLPVIPNGERMILGFSPIAIISMPYSFQLMKRSRMAYFVFCASNFLLFISTFWYFIIGNGLDILPYRWIFSV